jgi:hypothetical protein
MQGNAEDHRLVLSTNAENALRSPALASRENVNGCADGY